MQTFLNYQSTIKLDNGEVIPYANHFLAYIRACEVLSDETLLDTDKINILYKLLSKAEIKDKGERVQFVLKYFKLFENTEGGSEKLFDIEQDRELLYGAFFQAYGLNLDTADITTGQFLALLRSLPSETRFAEVVKIRGMKLPVGKGTEKQREEILRAKRSVALKGNKGNDTARAWQEFGALVKAWSVKGKPQTEGKQTNE